jgi:hypothetical protein
MRATTKQERKGILYSKVILGSKKAKKQPRQSEGRSSATSNQAGKQRKGKSIRCCTTKKKSIQLVVAAALYRIVSYRIIPSHPFN